MRVQLPQAEMLLGGLDERIADNRILQAALFLYKEHSDCIVTLVTKDTNMRLKADALGIPAEDYLQSSNHVESGFCGVDTVDVSEEVVTHIYANKQISVADVLSEEEELVFFPNQFLILRNDQNMKQTALTRFIVPDTLVDNESEDEVDLSLYQEKGVIQVVNQIVESVWGLKPRNREQLFALNLLLDPNVHCVTLTGMAGTGKTLLAIAAGLSMTMDNNYIEDWLFHDLFFPWVGTWVFYRGCF